MSLFKKVEAKIHSERAAHAERAAEHDAYAAAVMKLAQPGVAPAALLAAVPPVSAAMSPQTAAALKLQSVTALANALLADERLSSSEEAQLIAVADGLQVTMGQLEQNDSTLPTRLIVAQVNDGRLPVLAASAVRLILKKGEAAHLATAATLLKEQVNREFRGGSRGISFRVAKGVYYRTGQFKGHSVVTGTTAVAADSGILTVTSQRAVFSGKNSSLEFPYAKLLDITRYSDGVKFAVSNRQKASTFQIGANADEVNAVLHAAVEKFQS